MHNVELPGDLVDFVMQRRGRLEVFDDINPASTALIVIDMQNAYLQEDGPFHLQAASGIIPNINELANTLRDKGGIVAWVQHTNGEKDSPGYWSMYFENFVDEKIRNELAQALVPGNHYHDLFSELDVREDDLVMQKSRFSAMIPGSSILPAELRQRNIDTLIITGTLTNVCCESTARDSMMLDYRVFMPIDGTAARSDNDHLAGLRTVCQAIGDVRPCKEIIDLIKKG